MRLYSKSGFLAAARGFARALALLSLLLTSLLPVQQAAAQTAAYQAPTASTAPPQPYPVTYNDTNTDLSVKVWGGSIDIRRGYSDGAWYSNINWMPIKFTYDSLDGSIQTITRGRTDYAKAAAGIYQDAYYDTLRVTATGYHWNNPKADWIDYNPAGEIKAFGDRNGPIATFLYSGTQTSTVTVGGATATWNLAGGSGGTVPVTPPSEGHITGILDHNGNQALWFDYDTNNTLIAIRDSTGRKVQYTQTATANGQLLAVIDPNGNTWTYQITNIAPPAPGGGQLLVASAGGSGGGTAVSITPPPPPPDSDCALRADGPTITVQDPEGHSTTRHYYNNGALALTQYPDGTAVCVNQDYDSAKQIFYTREIGPYTPNGAGIPLGAKLVETWSGLEQDKGRGEILRRDINGVTVEKQSLDTASHTTTITDARGLNTAITRDQWYNITKITYPDGSTVTNQYDPNYSNLLQHIDENGVITQNTYDAHGNLIKTIEAYGLPEQRTTEYTYDASGQRISMIQRGDANTADATTQYAYDAYGNVTQVTNAEGGVTAYTYDVMGNAITKTDPRGNVWKRTFDNRGNLTSFTDPLNRTNSISYNKTGLPVSIIDAANNTSTLSFDPTGKLLTVTDPYGAKTSRTYDSAGNPTSLTDAANHTQKQEYDVDGRLVKDIDGNNNVTQLVFGDSTSGLNRLLIKVIYPTLSQEFKYDNRNRITQSISSSSGTAQVLDGGGTQARKDQYDAAGNLTNVIDPASRGIARRYNGLGQLTQITDPAGGVAQLGYDAHGNVISVKDAKGNTYTLAYDRLDRMVREISPLGQAVTYAYDVNGNLIQATDPKGQINKYTYDAANRRIREDRYATASDTVPAKTINYTWNVLDHLTGYSDGTTEGAFTYDVQQIRQTGQSVNYGVFSLSTSTAYNVLGQKSSITYPDGAQYSYAYDGNNQLSTVTLPTGSITINSYLWTVPSQITLPGGTVRNLTYDGLLRTKGIDVKDPGQSQVMSYQYTYDLTSNIVTKATEQGTANYGYDTLDHLTSAAYTNAAQTSEAYTYDPIANRLTSAKTSAAWTYDANSQLLSADNLSYTYDANGNTLSVTDSLNAANNRNYVYDIDNRLIEVHDGNNALIASYTYDPFGRRLSKTVVSNGSSITQYFFYNFEGLIAEADSSGNITRSYGYAPGSGYSTNPLFTKIGTQYYYYQNDHLGTPMKLVNQAGTVVWSATYDAFGNATVDPSSAVTNNLRFPGQYYDAETGLHYNRMRYYDSNTGRYTTTDPIKLAAGVNMYAYVYGNPLAYMDSDGNIPIFIITAAIGAAGGFFGNLIFQTIRFHGNLSCVNMTDALVAGAAGGVAGALLPITGTTLLGAALTGAVTNVGGYLAASAIKGEEITGAGIGVAAVSGLVGGGIAGKLANPSLFTSGRLSAWTDWSALTEANTDAMTLGRVVAGGEAGSLDPNSSCACENK